MRYANLQLLGDGAWSVGAQRVVVGQDAVVTTLNAEVGSRVTKLGLDVQMTGKGGTSKVLGLLAAGDDQHIDINSVQDLAADHTTSDLLYLSALYDRAHASFYGMTSVRHGTQADEQLPGVPQPAAQPEGRRRADPGARDRDERHPALRPRRDRRRDRPDELFYAQSRGLDADAAERMIVRGFFEQVVAKIDDETIRERVLAALARRIGTTSSRSWRHDGPRADCHRFVTVARAGDVEPGTVRVVEVDGRSLCLGQTEDGEWGAIDNVCTHDGGTLGEGELDDSGVECPRHGGRFDLFSGRVLALPPVRPGQRLRDRARSATRSGCGWSDR